MTRTTKLVLIGGGVLAAAGLLWWALTPSAAASGTSGSANPSTGTSTAGTGASLLSTGSVGQLVQNKVTSATTAVKRIFVGTVPGGTPTGSTTAQHAATAASSQVVK